MPASPVADRAEIDRALALLYEPGIVVELRMPKTRQRTISGYFDDLSLLAAAAVKVNGAGAGVYTTLNVVAPALLARARNRLKPYADATTTDADILRRRWLLLDFDPIRAAGISSTDAEHEAAVAAARTAMHWLHSHGVPAESMLLASSGNGAHLLVRGDLPNDEPSRMLVQRILDAVALFCGTPGVTVDRTVYNAARITKLYGTVAAKGDATEERPHRRAQLLDVPGVLVPVPVVVLERIAALLPHEDPSEPKSRRRSDFDVRAWLADHGLVIQREKPWHSGATVLELALCPFNAEHAGSAVIIIWPSGKLMFRCLHNSCLDKVWRDVRDRHEPDRPRGHTRRARASQPAMDGSATSAAAGDVIRLTDYGNARRLVEAYGQNLHFCRPWRQWFAWDERRWLRDDRQQVFRYAKNITATFFREAAGTSDRDLQEQLAGHALRSQRAERLRAMVTLAESEPGIPIVPADLDRDPFLFNVLNGTINLRTGAIREHRREDLITKLAPVVYDPTASLALWDHFLRDATAGLDPTLDAIAATAGYREFLQRAAGYSLTGDTSEEVFFLIHGPAASGKSTFIEAVKATLGEYAKTADFETFLVKRGDAGVRNDLAALVGSRLVASIEVDEGKELAQGLVKHLTGGETATARFLYAEFFEFKPTFKLWLAVNHAPKVQDLDDALWRRIRRLPFEHTVPKEQRDKAIKRTLTTPTVAGPAILAWAVQGCLAWQRDGLEPPPIVEAATAQYQADQDPLVDFYAECCVFAPDAWVASGALREAYLTWAKANGIRRPLSARAMGQRLARRGCTAKRRYCPEPDSKKVRGWRGVGLQTEAEPDDE